MKTYEDACDDLRDLVNKWVDEELDGNDCVRALGAIVLTLCFQQPGTVGPAEAFAEFQKTIALGYDRTKRELEKLESLDLRSSVEKKDEPN